MKKILLQMLLAIFVVVGGTTAAHAEGEVQFPGISQFDYDTSYGYFFLKDPQSEESILASEYRKLNIINVSDGTVIRTFDTEHSTYTFTANDTNTYFVYSGSNYLTVFNSFGESIFKESTISYNGERFEYFGNVAFIPNTNTLVMTSNYSTKLLGFDVDQQQGTFYRNIKQGSKLAVSSQYIALSGAVNEVTIIDTKGTYIDTIQADMNVKTMEFTADGKKLVLGGESNQLAIYDVEKGFEKISLTSTQFALSKNETFSTIDIDSTGKYLIAKAWIDYSSSVRMFDFQTGQRIYTNLDNVDYVNAVRISSGGKYIIVNGSVYDGKNIKKRVTDIAIPTNYQTVQLGTKNTLKLQVTLADGTTKDITSGVNWATNAVNIAYLDSKTGQLVAKKIGSVDLKVTYLGFEATIPVKVIDTKPPVIKGASNITAPLGETFNSKSGVTAQDAGDGNLTSKIKVTGTVNTKKEGKYTLTYTVTDQAGNKATVKRVVTVKKMLSSNFYNYTSSNGNKFIVHKGVYNKNGSTIYKLTFSPYFYDSVKKSTFMIEANIKPSSTIYMKKITITAGNKTISHTVNSSNLSFYSDSENYYFKPNTSLINFLKKNVTSKQTVKIKFEGYYGSLSYTLNAKQKSAIIDSLKYAGY